MDISDNIQTHRNRNPDRNLPPPHAHQHRRARSIGSSVLSSQLFDAGQRQSDGFNETVVDVHSTDDEIVTTTNSTNNSTINHDSRVETNRKTDVGTHNAPPDLESTTCQLPRSRETMLSVLISAYQVRWRAVEERLSTHPSEASVLDGEGRSVLHRALTRRPDDYPPVRIVRKLLQASPRSIWERHDNKTTTLIEMACWRRASLETLEVLTSARPSIPEDAPSIMALWKAYVELHGGDESSLIDFLRSGDANDMDIVGDDEHDRHGGDNNDGGRYRNHNETESFLVGCKFQLILKYLTTEQMRPCAIQTALSSPHCSLELFKIFMDVLGSSSISFKFDLTRFDSSRSTQSGPSVEKVEYYNLQLKNHETGLTAGNPTTKRPKPVLMTMNSLLANDRPSTGSRMRPIWISPELEAILDRIDKTATSSSNNVTRSDLHHQFVATIRTPVDPMWNQLIGAAQLLHCPVPLMRILIDLHPEKLLHADTQGWLPLHHAVAGPTRDELLSMILEACPEACKHHESSTGRLPFHLACVSGKGVWLLNQLQKYFPKSIEQNDPFLRLPPALLAAQSDRASIGNLYHLLRSFPDVLLCNTARDPTTE